MGILGYSTIIAIQPQAASRRTVQGLELDVRRSNY